MPGQRIEAASGHTIKYRAGKRERQQRALDDALASGQPIADDEPTHPERSVFQYRELGRQIGQMMAAMATNTPRVVPLQVRNGGATAQFPAESWVEVPTLVAGTRIQPLAADDAPEWLIANERAFALSRMLTSEWLAEPKAETLHKALSVFPMFGVVEDMLGLAGKLQEGVLGVGW